MSKKIFVFAGEMSGDLYGEKLLRALWERDPSLKIYGVGGPRMREAGLECLMPMEAFQVMGFVDVFLALPKLMRQFYAVSSLILARNPDLVLFIDYPGFNLRMAAHLRKKGYRGKLCHFICPSVWAWGKARIPLMAKNLDLLLTILPFEAKYFADTSLKITYVGHPLTKRLEDYPYRKGLFPQDRRILSLFPGSRKKELVRNLPLMLKTASQLHLRYPDLLFAVSVSQERYRPLIETMIREQGLENQVLLVSGENTYELMKASYLALAKSGTVTLELALHQIPTVVIYKVSLLDFLLVKYILRIILPHYCIVNIIAEKEVFPELFGPQLTEESLLFSIQQFLDSPALRETCRQECIRIRDLLYNKSASDEAARAICNL